MTIHLKKQSSRAAIFAAILLFQNQAAICALGTSFFTVSEGRDLMTYVSDNYTSYSVPSPFTIQLGHVYVTYTFVKYISLIVCVALCHFHSICLCLSVSFSLSLSISLSLSFSLFLSVTV